MRRLYLAIFVMCICSVMAVNAQDEACSPELLPIIEIATDFCEDVGQNSVCYGNSLIEVDITEGNFAQPGDVVDLENLVSLVTSPYTPDSEEWGLAVFNLQANLPDTLPGQLVTILVFGDATINTDDDPSEAYDNPLQAFYLRTGIGRTSCNDLPDGGILIQNSADEPAELMINGFEITINSTALFTAETNADLSISTFEGTITVSDGDHVVDIAEGFSATITQDSDFDVPELTPDDNNDGLPFSALPDPVPSVGEPSVSAVGLLDCSGSGGIDVAVGSTVVLRGGWAEEAIGDLLAYVSSNPAYLEYDGTALTHRFRTGPAPWQDGDRSGFRVDWYWEIADITAGTHTAVWFVADTTVTCDIRSN